MTSLKAQELLQNNLTIPSLPVIVQEAERLLSDPEAGTKELGALIAQDAPITAKVLRIANSAYYGLAEPCVSTEQAAAVLGMRVLRNVLTQAAVMSEFSHLRGIDGFSIDDLWRHSIATGHVCATLAKKCTTPLSLTPEEFYVCGLLHDLGQIVMLSSLGDKYVDVIQQAKADEIPIQKAEECLLGFNHTDVGFVVATRWNLPEDVAHAIQYHHGPREAVENDPVVSLVANANVLVNRVSAINRMSAGLVFDPGTCEQLGLDITHMDEIVELTHQSLATAEV